MHGLNEWNENPVLISVDSLETPLKDIEFPAVTICPDFQPDYSALGELVLNLLKFNCDVGDNDCEKLRQELHVKNTLDNIYYVLDDAFDEIKFEPNYFNSTYSNCTTVSGAATTGSQCIFPFEYHGKMHSECTWDGEGYHYDNSGEDWLNWINAAEDVGLYGWCATKVDNTSQYIPPHWGNCGPGCPIPLIQEGNNAINI